jgi:hypothetical protein
MSYCWAQRVWGMAEGVTPLQTDAVTKISFDEHKLVTIADLRSFLTTSSSPFFRSLAKTQSIQLHTGPPLTQTDPNYERSKKLITTWLKDQSKPHPKGFEEALCCEFSRTDKPHLTDQSLITDDKALLTAFNWTQMTLFVTASSKKEASKTTWFPQINCTKTNGVEPVLG